MDDVKHGSLVSLVLMTLALNSSVVLLFQCFSCKLSTSRCYETPGTLLLHNSIRVRLLHVFVFIVVITSKYALCGSNVLIVIITYDLDLN